MNFTHIGFFAGIGGFEIAANWMNWKTVAWVENDPFCQDVLLYWFEAKGYNDLTKVDFTAYENKIDILTGGFPCQPFSLAGKRRGTNDPRNLWPEMFRGIREIQPSWVVAENVPGLLSWGGGLLFEQICDDLESEGYEVQAVNIPACAFGAPHERQRLWIVAYSNKAARKRKGVGLWNFTNTGRCTKFTNTNTTGLQNGTRAKRKAGIKAGERCQHYGIFTSPFVTYANQRTDAEQDGGVFSESGNGVGENVANTPAIRWGQRTQKPGSERTLQNVPDWQGFPTFSPFCGGDDGFSDRLDAFAIHTRDRKRKLKGAAAAAKTRVESLKAYGNAIVPQVALAIFQAIEEANKILANGQDTKG